MGNIGVFKALDYFMLRVPLLSMTCYQDVFQHKEENKEIITTKMMEKLVMLSTDPLIREAIGSTSRSLLHSMDKLAIQKELPKGKQTAISFVKYLIRMSTRATPFGLLAGVTAGTFGEKTQVELENLTQYGKRTRPDMEWLMEFINQLEQRIEVVEQVKVATNSAIFQSGNRLEIPYISQYGQEREATDYKGMESVSIRATAVVLYTLEQGKQGLYFYELVRKVQEKYPETGNEKIKNFVWQLVQSQFLISELRPVLMVDTFSSPLDYIMDKLKNLQGITQEKIQLAEIKQFISEYDQQELGQGGAIFGKTVRTMNEMIPSQNPLQIDLAVKTRANVLTKQIATDLGEAAECLWRLSPAETSTPGLVAYRNAFIEKYGVYREIPVLELLDNDRGLGAPPTYQFPPSRWEVKSDKDPSEVSKLEKFFLEQIPKTIKNKEAEIEIQAIQIADLEPIPGNRASVPASLELYCSIIATSQQAVDDGDYNIVLGPNTGSTGAGKTFGRFVDVLPKACQQEYYRTNELEKTHLGNDVVTAELVYMPHAGRSANVVISQNRRDYEIAIATNSSKEEQATLALSDLLIGVKDNHFYIKSRVLDKRVMVTTGHMLNMLNAPNVYRFLLEASQDEVRNWSPLRLGKVIEFPYIPRIRFKKVILSPASWKLTWQLLNTSKDLVTKEKFPDVISRWRGEWQVPQFVFMTEFDNRILLDLENPIHLEILFEELGHQPAGGRITLLEMSGKFTDHWLGGPGGKYFEEIVVPLIANKTTVKMEEEIPLIKKEGVADSLRMKYPGSDWLYVKLYGNSSREEEFIAFALRDFCNQVIHEQHLATEWFYIRYADPQPHFRVRFRGEPQVLTSKLLPAMHQWWHQLTEDGLLSRVVIDTYEREVERYGGPDLIPQMETLFYADSVVTSDLLFVKRAGKLTIELETIGVVSIIHLLTSMDWDMDQQIAWLDKLIIPKEYLADFHKQRKLYMHLGDGEENWQNLRKYQHGEYIYNSLLQRGKQVKALGDRMKALEEGQTLLNSQSDIIGSLIHMHCNRLFGVDREKEKRIMAVTRHTLYNIKQHKLFATGKVNAGKKQVANNS